MRSKWLTPGNLIIVILVSSIAFLWPTWASLHVYWLDSTRYSHGYLIVLTCVYLLYVQRNDLNSKSPTPTFPALILLGVFLLIWLAAVLASIQAMHQVVLPIVVWTMFLVVLGWPIAKRLILPVAYLYLAIPIWGSGDFALQWLTVRAVEIALWVFQVPAFINGNLVSLPAGAFEVSGGCSGLHYFIISLAISLLYGALWLRTIRNKVVIVGLAVMVALLTNWVRVFSIVYAGHVTDMQHYLVTHDHYNYGWVLFTIALVPYLFFVRRVEQAEPNVGHPDPATEHKSIAGVAHRTPVALAGCLLCLVVSSGMIYARISGGDEGPIEAKLPAAQGAWSVRVGGEGNWRPYYVGAADEVLGEYRRNTGLVDLYVNLYKGQQQGRELIGYENRIEGRDHWIRTGSRIRQVPLAEFGHLWRVREVDLKTRFGDRRVLYLWYDVDGTQEVNDVWAKLRFGLNMLRGRPDAGVFILSAQCRDDCDDARALLREWLSVHAEEIGIG